MKYTFIILLSLSIGFCTGKVVFDKPHKADIHDFVLRNGYLITEAENCVDVNRPPDHYDKGIAFRRTAESKYPFFVITENYIEYRGCRMYASMLRQRFGLNPKHKDKF